MAGGRGGRPRLPSRLKEIRGTLRPHRETTELPASIPLGMIIAPSDLSERELQFFNESVRMLEEQGRASPHFAGTVVRLARCDAAIERLSAVIEVLGDTIEKRGGRYGDVIMDRPEVRQRLKYMTEARQLSNDLMLTPTAALRLGGEKKKDHNPFDDI